MLSQKLQLRCIVRCIYQIVNRSLVYTRLFSVRQFHWNSQTVTGAIRCCLVLMINSRENPYVYSTYDLYFLFPLLGFHYHRLDDEITSNALPRETIRLVWTGGHVAPY